MARYRITGLPLRASPGHGAGPRGDRGRRGRGWAARRGSGRRGNRARLVAAAASCRRHGDAGSPNSRSIAVRSRCPSECPTSTPTRARRWVRSAPHSTGCWATSPTRLRPDTRARRGYGSSSPTPATSCVRRWPPSAGYAEVARRGRDAVPARHRARAAPGRVREHPDDIARRGPAAARPPRLGPTARPRTGRPVAAGRRRRRATPTSPAGTTAGGSTCPRTR